MNKPLSPQRRSWLQKQGQRGALALLLGRAELAFGATILAVRVWPARDYTRVTIESDTPLDASHLLAESPPRLGVDINGLDLNLALRELVGKIQHDDPYIAGVRVGQYKPHVVRIVFDLKQNIRPEQFVLPPVAAYRHRLVLDLFPINEVDPLLSLVREKDGVQPSAAVVAEKPPSPEAPASPAVPASRAASDALGDLIARVDRPAEVLAASSSATAAASASTAASGASAGLLAQAPAAARAASAPGVAAASASGAAAATLASGSPAAVAKAATTPGAVAQTTNTTAARGKESAATAATAAERRTVDRLIIVAIDAGHGGEDPGATGPTGLREKDVVLDIALKLRKRLNAEPRMRVMLTRNADYFVPLQDRVRKAQRVQADLFVSLHADAFSSPKARGASVFALSTRGASSAAAQWMAQRENAADAVGGVNLSQVQDPQLLQAMLDMSTTAQVKDSLRLGHEVLRRIGKVGRLHKPRVEQAGFVVLKAPDIPSILVETAFISNPEEERQLRSGDYRAELVEAIAAGIKRYFERNPPLARQRQL